MMVTYNIILILILVFEIKKENKIKSKKIKENKVKFTFDISNKRDKVEIVLVSFLNLYFKLYLISISTSSTFLVCFILFTNYLIY